MVLSEIKLPPVRFTLCLAGGFSFALAPDEAGSDGRRALSKFFGKGEAMRLHPLGGAGRGGERAFSDVFQGGPAPRIEHQRLR